MLVVAVGLLAAGCGSGGHKTVAAKPAATPTTSTTAAHHPTTTRAHQTPVRAPTNRGKPPKVAGLTSFQAAYALGNLLRHQAQTANSAAAAARRAAARNPANKTCKVTFRSRAIPVACGLQRSLQQAALHNGALARLLAAMSSRSH